MLIGLTHWTGYTVFSVVSGVVLVLMALVPGEKPGTRIGYFFGGIVMGAYGIYVAHETSGVYFFPIYIFVVPIIGVAYFVKNLAGLSARPAPPRRNPPNRPPVAPGGSQPTHPPAQPTRHLSPPSPPPHTAPRLEYQNIAAPAPAVPPPPAPRSDPAPGRIVIDVSDLHDD